MIEALRKKIIEIMESHNHMTVALVRPDGYPQAVTLSYVNKGTTLYFGTDADTRKGRFLKRNQSVSITICKDYDEWDSLQSLCIAGQAERVDDLAEFKQVRDLVLKKFTTLPHYNPESPETAIFFRVLPLKVSVLDYTQGIGHAEHFEM